MQKLFDILSLFRKGAEVANPEAWKDAGNAGTLVAAAVMALVKVLGDFGIGVQITLEQAASIGGGAASMWLFIVHNITSKRAGILPAKPDLQGVDGATGTRVQRVDKTADTAPNNPTQGLP